MLKRISKLTNIGRFKNASCGSAVFEKISIIFGRNTYGKSTLGDLLSSIESNDLSAVIGRRSIPNDHTPMEATLKFIPNGQEKEFPLNMGSEGWEPSLPTGLQIVVFDDGFYHNNIFAARQFTRTTKENFSDFVLGAKGVAKARIIAEKNREKSTATRSRNRLESDAFSKIDDLPNFLTLTPKGSAESIQSKIDELRKKYDALDKQRKNSADIKERKTCRTLSWYYDFDNTLQELNEVFRASLDSHHRGAQRKLAEHIGKHFKYSSGAEEWIRTGLMQNNGTSCQFCSQPLGDSARNLLDVYRQSFDASYDTHERTINKKLSEISERLTPNKADKTKLTIADNGAAYISYPELVENLEYIALRKELEVAESNFRLTLDEWSESHAKFKKRLQEAVKRKKALPHVAVTSVFEDELSELGKKLATDATTYDDLVSRMNAELQKFKDSVDPDALTSRLKDLPHARNNEKRALSRLELSEQVERYKALDLTVGDLSREIPTLEKELRAEQSAFLDTFFQSLNDWFKAFGSHDFSLEKGEDRTGHTPIYFLKVKFNGQRIPEKNLSRVFSESDRRALALGVFWAHLSVINSHDKKGLIVVLDDPVTSFDNNRITAVHQEIVKLSDDVRQIVILSHYDVEVSKFLSTYRKTKPVALLTIQLASGSASIVHADIDEFIKSEHEKKTAGIIKFIAGESALHNAGDLRIFLEQEIAHRFAQQISSSGVVNCMLEKRIDQLKDDGAVTKSVASNMHMWRESLNPGHHTWISDDVEDQRLTATRFMKFIYHDLVPA